MVEHVPGHPANETVNGVVLFGLRQRELEVVSVPGPLAVLYAVGPWHERLSARTVAHRVDVIAVEDRRTIHVVGAKTTTDRYDHRALLAVADLQLLSTRV